MRSYYLNLWNLFIDLLHTYWVSNCYLLNCSLSCYWIETEVSQVVVSWYCRYDAEVGDNRELYEGQPNDHPGTMGQQETITAASTHHGGTTATLCHAPGMSSRVRLPHLQSVLNCIAVKFFVCILHFIQPVIWNQEWILKVCHSLCLYRIITIIWTL